MTLRSLDLQSERYGSTGNIGENFRRLLGAPTLDLLQTVIREAVQNIADAATPGVGPEILIRLRTLSSAQRAALRSLGLSQLPAEPDSREKLLAALGRRDLVVLEICDFGTTGLGGPTRADRIPIGTEHTDFIDFLRNIGTPRTAEHGGGTYGFGKVALYRASRCSTILVDTLPAGVGAAGRRFIGCHVGHSFDLPEDGMLRRYTGRHWWGVADSEDGVVDPVTGTRAVELSAALGLPPRDEGQTGTSIMILDFDTEEEEVGLAGSRVAETVLWNFWPRMMCDVPSGRRFHCRIEVDGAEIGLPAPEDIAPFDILCKAMRAARAKSGNDVRPIESRRPARYLGTLAIEQGLRSQRRPLVAENSLIPAVLHHIALMRPVELVVKYLEGTPLPNPKMEWAGVFVASEEDDVERAFADSEPPAHDDWVPDNLPKGHAKTFVNVALRELKRIASEIGAVLPGGPSAAGAGVPLAPIANTLGAVLDRAHGDGAGPRRPSGTSRGKRPRRARASPAVFSRLELTEAGRTAVFMTEVTQDDSRTGAVLSASVAIAVEGAVAGRIEGGISQPTVLSIRSVDDSSAAIGATLPLDGKEGTFELRVLIPEEYAVVVDAVVLEAGAR